MKIDEHALIDEVDNLPKDSLVYRFFFKMLTEGSAKKRRIFKAIIKSICNDR